MDAVLSELIQRSFGGPLTLQKVIENVKYELGKAINCIMRIRGLCRAKLSKSIPWLYLQFQLYLFVACMHVRVRVRGC